MAVNLRDHVTNRESGGLARTLGENGHYLLALLRRVNHDAGTVEDAALVPIGTFLQVETAPHAIEGDVELAENAAPDVACRFLGNGGAGRKIKDK
jgi:hypothetical protein